MLGVIVALPGSARAQTYSVLKSFAGGDGQNPGATLLLSGSTTYAGGDFGNGVVFALNLAPALTATNLAGTPGLTWPAIESLTYQVQYKTNLNQPLWSDLGSPLTATDSVVTLPTPVGSNPQQFFRVNVPQ